jgi:hypothetical protein
MKEEEKEELPEETETVTTKKTRLSKIEFAQDTEGTQLIKEEEALTGGVKLKVYIRYAQTVGIVMAVGMVLFSISHQVFSLLSSFWLTSWSEDNDSEIPEKRDNYLLVFGLYGVGQSEFFVDPCL